MSIYVRFCHRRSRRRFSKGKRELLLGVVWRREGAMMMMMMIKMMMMNFAFVVAT